MLWIKYSAPDRGTFCLNSTRYYREHGYEKPNDRSFDRHENEIALGDSIASGNEGLVSCWVVLKQPEIDWMIRRKEFPKKSIAILSTVGKVRGLIEQHLKWFIMQPWQFEHKRVRYDDWTLRKLKGFDVKSATDHIFWKDPQYKSQEEYRFALKLKANQSDLTTLIFRIEPSEYIDLVRVASNQPENIENIKKREDVHKLMAWTKCSGVKLQLDTEVSGGILDSDTTMQISTR